MKYPLFSQIVVAEDISSHDLRRGDLATVVEHYAPPPDQEPGYEIEVFNAVGDTVAVVTVRESQIEAPRQDERLCVRPAELAVNAA
jgi:hypothetical protein